MNRRAWTAVLILITIGAVALFLWEAQQLSQSQANLQAAWGTATQQAVLNNRQATSGAQEVAQAATQAADAQSQAVQNAQDAAGTQQAQTARQTALAQAQALDDARNAAATEQADLQTQMAATVASFQNDAATSQAESLADAATSMAAIQDAAIRDLQNRASMAQFQAVFNANNQAATQMAQLLVTQTALEAQLATAQSSTGNTGGSQNTSPTVVAPTLAPAATLAPSPETPIPATQSASAAPTATLEGWKSFETPGMVVWLPTSYVGGDLTQHAADVAAQLQALGADYNGPATYVQSNSAGFALIAFDTSPSVSPATIYMRVVTGDLGTTTDIQTFLSNYVSQSSGQVTIIEQGVVSLGNYQAGRIVVELSTSGGTKFRSLTYLLLNGTTAWVVSYFAVATDFSTQLPTFEQSAQTISLTP